MALNGAARMPDSPKIKELPFYELPQDNFLLWNPLSLPRRAKVS